MPKIGVVLSNYCLIGKCESTVEIYQSTRFTCRKELDEKHDRTPSTSPTISHNMCCTQETLLKSLWNVPGLHVCHY